MPPRSGEIDENIVTYTYNSAGNSTGAKYSSNDRDDWDMYAYKYEKRMPLLGRSRVPSKVL